MSIGPRTKIKIKLVIIILSRFPEWYTAPMKKIVVEGLDASTTDPTLVEIEEANLTTEQMRALKGIIEKFGKSTGIGTFTITLDDPTELNALFNANITEIEFEAATAVISEDNPLSCCESECEDEDELEAIDALSVLAPDPE